MSSTNNIRTVVIPYAQQLANIDKQRDGLARLKSFKALSANGGPIDAAIATQQSRVDDMQARLDANTEHADLHYYIAIDELPKDTNILLLVKKNFGKHAYLKPENEDRARFAGRTVEL